MAASPTEEFGPYRVYEQLGIGGMASVHRAELAGADGFQHVVALKRMLPHVAANDEMVKAFVREARLASHLRHANVAQTYELGRVGEIYFIAMELVRGRNLRELLKHVATTNMGPMPVPVALHILNQICDSLDYAHNLCDETGQPLGIIHRDVTPSNIIVSQDGVVKLIDFGIAKASAAGMQTMSGTLKGKFGYMAPEYIAGSIDARADLFALGVIAHELLTNRPLFSGRDDLETLTRVQQMEIQPPSRRNPNVPREIDDIVMTALARNPDDRWQHATALRAALGTLTRRLGLATTNPAVAQWIEYAFAQTKPGLPLGLGLDHELDDSMPSISMEVGTTELSPSQRFALITPLTIGRAMPDPADTVPIGTPASITAQRSIPPTNRSVPPPRSVPPAEISGETYQAAVQRYERHEGLSPGQNLMSDAVIPALGRQSGARPVIATTPGHPTLFDAGGAPAATPRMVRSAGSGSSSVLTAARVSSPMPATPPQADGPAVAPSTPAASKGLLLPIVMMLVIAGVVAAVVYFVLPQL